MCKAIVKTLVWFWNSFSACGEAGPGRMGPALFLSPCSVLGASPLQEELQHEALSHVSLQWVNLVSPTHIHPELHNVILFGVGVFVDVIKIR